MTVINKKKFHCKIFENIAINNLTLDPAHPGSGLSKNAWIWICIQGNRIRNTALGLKY